MRVLIIGGGGFLGSALLKHLAAKFTCICFGHDTRYAQLRPLVPAAVEFVSGEVTDEKLLRQVIARVDAVLYVAGTGGEAHCSMNPVRAVSAHVVGTRLVLKEVLRNHIKRLIFTSTIAVYGTYRQRQMPLTEEMGTRADEFYGVLKDIAESDLIEAGQYQIFRLANVYGYGSGLFSLSSGVIGKYVELIGKREPLQAYGNGEQLIDYVHIDDVCRAYEMALKRPEQNFIYNLGGGQPVSIKDIAGLIRGIAQTEFGYEPEIKFVPGSTNKLWPDRWLSISKIESEMEWRPQISLATGIKAMLTKWVGKKGETLMGDLK